MAAQAAPPAASEDISTDANVAAVTNQALIPVFVGGVLYLPGEEMPVLPAED